MLTAPIHPPLTAVASMLAVVARPPRETAVRIHEVSKRFVVRRTWPQMLRRPLDRSFVTVVDRVSCDVARGELFGVLGPNGAGKTTLFKMISTMVTPDAGTVTVVDRDTVREDAAVRQLVGSVMANERSLQWRLSAVENLRLFAALHGLRRREADVRIAELLEVVRLADTGEKMAGTFSSGMKQRLLVARALLVRPAVLLLDEPTRSMDPISARQFREFLRADLVERHGCTILLATHSSEEAFGFCDRIGVLAKGRLLAVGTSDELSRTYNRDRFQVWTREPDHGAFAILAATGAVQDVVAQPRDAEGWAMVQLVIPGGLTESRRVLEELVAAGVSVGRFERTERSIADLIERVVHHEEARR